MNALDAIAVVNSHAQRLELRIRAITTSLLDILNTRDSTSACARSEASLPLTTVLGAAIREKRT